MKKNYPLYDNENEIDLIALFKIFWNGKIKILLITIISFLVGSVYSSQIPINYLNSLTINPNKNSEFIKYDYMQKLLKINKSNQSNQSYQLNQLNLTSQSNQSNQSNQLNLFRFINELKFNIEDQEMELFNNAKSLEIVKLNENEESYIINFKWHDPDEAKKVLQDILNLTSKNLKRSIDLELLQLLEFEKRLLLSKNLNRLDYLKEQSAIARELNIIDNQIESVNLSQAAVSLNISTADIAYYLRGYKAIDKEIELIQNRESQNLKFIEQEINDFKDTEIEFVKYNIYSMKSNSLKNTKSILTTSILLGLIVGIFYVLISNALQSQTLSKKTK